MPVLAASISRNRFFAERGLRSLQCPLPWPGLCIPLFMYNTDGFPNQEQVSAWVRSFSVTVVCLSNIQSCQSGVSCHSDQVPLPPLVKFFTCCSWSELLLRSDFSDCKSAALHPLNSILSVCRILIIGYLFSDLYFWITCCFRSWKTGHKRQWLCSGF